MTYLKKKRNFFALATFWLLACWLTISEAESTELSVYLDKALTADSDFDRRESMSLIASANTEEAARAYVAVLDQRIVPSNERLLPYLYVMFEPQVSKEVNRIYAEGLRNVDSARFDKFEKALAMGIRSKDGESAATKGLMEEFTLVSRNHEEWGYSDFLLTILSKTGVEEASAFAVRTVLESTDPAVKLKIEEILRESNSSHSLRIMRQWNSVESGDFDLIVAEHYLKSIAQFGDQEDQDFLDWIEKHAQTLFHEQVYEERVRPLLASATEKVRSRSATAVDGLSRSYGKRIFLVLLLASCFGALFVFKRKSKKTAA